MDAPQSKTPAGGPGQFDAAQQNLFEQARFSPTHANAATIADRDVLQGQQRRALLELVNGPLTREQLDRCACASNGPEVVRCLRGLGLQIFCEMRRGTNRHGEPCRYGVYRLLPGQTALARALLYGTSKEGRHE